MQSKFHLRILLKLNGDICYCIFKAWQLQHDNIFYSLITQFNIM